MSAIDKVIEQLPYGDGAFRRRFITGLIFVATLTVNCLWYFPPGHGATAAKAFGEFIGFEPKDLLNSPQALFVAAIVIFALGSIADAMIEGYIVRGVSISMVAFQFVVDVARDWYPVFRVLWWVPTLLL